MGPRGRIAIAAGGLVLGGAVLLLLSRRPGLPPDLAGTLVFVSDRSGVESLHVRRLPRGPDRRITSTSEPVRDPALSPDGRRVAFAMGGQIGVVTLATEDVRMLTLGVDWHDASPSWRPDGKAIAVSSRRGAGANAGLHLLDLELAEGGVVRHVLTQTRGKDDLSPAFAPDGLSLVFVREENLFRLSLADGRTARLTGSFRRYRRARFLPRGRIVALWSQDKRFGIDAMDADGRNRETLSEGPVCYRTIAPSPDGRYLVATFAFDLGFHPTDAFRPRKTEEIRLLDARGAALGTLAGSWRHTNHSPDWGR
jgi:Tol biopolymer transport system component